MTRGAAREEPEPEESPTPGETPEETFPTPISPPATPLPTPAACAFYGIGQMGDLWMINPTVPSAVHVGNTNVYNTSDLAILPDGKMIMITTDKAYQVDPNTAQAYQYESAAWLEGQNALDALPDGRLLVGGGTMVKIVGTGAPTFDPLPFGAASMSGDLAVAGSIAWGSAVDNWEGNDHLIQVDLTSGAVTDKGQFTKPLMYGLDVACDGQLYGMSAGEPDQNKPPRVFRINTTGPSVVDLGELIGPTRLWGGAGPVAP